MELDASEKPSLSHDIDDTAITHLVVGTIDLPMRGDLPVTQWVSLHNG